jgi:penicillin-binding protein 1A
MTKPFRLALKLFAGLILVIGLLFLTIYLSIYFGLFGKLPNKEELAGIRNEEATLIYSSDGSMIGKIFASNRTNLKWEEVPVQLVNALICTEDKRFFSHGGIDQMGYIRVIFKTLLSGDRSSGGGSTITQQLAKNLYGRKKIGILTLPVAKIREAIIAYRMEKIYSKDEIILLYLNSVPFGENVFGIEAAAQRFFNKSTPDLKVEQMALLVGMLKANTFYNPRLNPENSVSRRNLVLQLMEEQNYLSRLMVDSLLKLPPGVNYSNYELNSPAGYFVYQVSRQADEILKVQQEKTGHHYDLKKDGLKIYTTLDTALQKMAIQSVRLHLTKMQKLLDSEMKNRNTRKSWEKEMSVKNDPFWKENDSITGEVFKWTEDQNEIATYRDSLWHYYRMLHAAVYMIEPGTGNIRAWVGGNDYRYLPYDLVLSRRQIASAFKPVLYAAALENGISSCTYLDNEEKEYEEYSGWHPRNFDNTSGDKMAMWYALAHSMNLPTVDLYFKTGYEALNKTCMELGLPVSKGDYPSVALGSMDITLQEIATAYSAFANNGNIAEPVMIESITDADGKVIYSNQKILSRRAIAPEIAEQMTAMLQKVITEGTGSTLRNTWQIRSGIAGKTGTSQDYTDAWFISYSPNLVIGTWVGAMDPEVHFHSSNGTGSKLALPIAGSIWSKIENTPFLYKKYTGSFYLPEYCFEQMDCEPIKEQTAVGEFFNNLFDDKKPDKEGSQEKGKNTDKETGKVGKFFKGIFKKKNK